RSRGTPPRARGGVRCRTWRATLSGRRPTPSTGADSGSRCGAAAWSGAPRRWPATRPASVPSSPSGRSEMSHSLHDLAEALRRAGLLRTAPAATPALSGLTADSRGVRPGMACGAGRGSQADGHRFLGDAIGRGAAAVVVERLDGVTVPALEVEDGRRAALVLGRAWHGDPASKLTLLGVTGTNGKTTTTALVRHLFNGSGKAG